MKVTNSTPLTITAEELQKTASKVTDSLYIRTSKDDNGVFYVTLIIRIDNNTYAAFIIEPEKESGMILDLLNQLLADIINGTIDTAPMLINKNLLIQSINIAAGELAKVNQNEFDPNMIYFQLVTGNVMSYAKNEIDWDQNIEHIDQIVQELVNLRHMIHDIGVSTGEEHEKTMNVISETVATIQENFKVTTSYDCFKDQSEEFKLVMKITDLITIYTELIMLTNIIRVQRDLSAYYENRNAAPEQPTPDPDAETLLTESEIESATDPAGSDNNIETADAEIVTPETAE